MNQKGDIPSMIYFIVILFVIGVFIFFMNHLTNELWTKFDDVLQPTDYNETAGETLRQIQTVENEIWDYGFLFLAFGFFIVLAMTSFSTRISPIFYWIYALLGLFMMTLSIIASNIWQSWAANPEFSNTLLRFPITDAILGTYYPSFGAAAIILGMILLFGKRPGV